jgi:hypothetical protein
MKKQLNEIANGIFIVENFISKSSANFLIKSIGSHLIKTPNKYVLCGPSGENSTPLEQVGEYGDSEEYNIGIDIFNSLLFTINELISEQFNSQHKVKSSFLGCMMPGSANKLHMDNRLVNDNGDIVLRENYEFDKSGLLYLNDEYTGGELYFPKQDISIKPKTGSLIFFEGDENRPHEVKEIKTGYRYNMVTFYEPVN